MPYYNASRSAYACVADTAIVRRREFSKLHRAAKFGQPCHAVADLSALKAVTNCAASNGDGSVVITPGFGVGATATRKLIEPATRMLNTGGP